MSSTDWGSLKVVELRAELQSRGLPTKGVKADLVKRLTEADADTDADAGADADAAQVNEPTTDVGSEEDAPDASPETEDQPMPDPSEPQELNVESQSAVDTKELLSEETPIPAAAQAEATTEPTSQEAIAEEPSAAQLDDNHQTDLPTSVPTSDTAVELQKRKRRSSTPPPSAKRARQEDEHHTKMEEDIVDYEGGDISESPEKKPANGSQDEQGLGKSGSAEPIVNEAQVALEVSGEDAYLKRVAIAESSKALSTTSEQAQDQSLGVSGKDAFQVQERVAIARPSDAPQHTLQSTPPSHEDRFDTPQQRHGETIAEATGPSVSSMHPPTSALYIRELMRPLRSEMVEEHIISLVTPPGSEPDPNLVEDFYLDLVRTHAFVKLTSVSAAQRVRAALHDQIWPNERNRKPLWVDFIPPDRLKEWVEEEESGGRGNAHRWEVVYEQDGDSMVAVHKEASPDARQFSKPPPTGPAAATVYPGIEAAPRGPRGRGAARPPLDNPTALQTHAYPPLFYQPLGEDIAERRIRNMRTFYSQNPPHDLGKDYNRYTFENGDSFVDRGTEVFVGIRPPHREKEHQERLRRERLGTAGPSSVADPQSRRDDYRPPARPMVTDVDRYSTFDDGRRFGGDRRPRNRGFRGDRGNRFRGEDPYRYRPGY